MAASEDIANDSQAERYDRQLRVWGDRGQLLIRSAKVLVLGSGATAAEALRNLVLPGIGAFVIIDDRIIRSRDVNSNFFVEETDVGRPRAQAVCQSMLELNPCVEGEYFCVSARQYLINYACKEESIETICTDQSFRRRLSPKCARYGERPPPISTFDLVIGCQLDVDDELMLSRTCEIGRPLRRGTDVRFITKRRDTETAHRQGQEQDSVPLDIRIRSAGSDEMPETITASASDRFSKVARDTRDEGGRDVSTVNEAIPLLLVGCLGFVGWLRVWGGEYCLVERRPEGNRTDFRIANPFPGLLEYARTFNLALLDDTQHARVPFPVLLILAIEACKKKNEWRERESIRRVALENTLRGWRRNPDEANFTEALENVHRALRPASPDADALQVLERSAYDSVPCTPFWRLARAVWHFYQSEGHLPTCALDTDFTSSTDNFQSLRRLFDDQARRDLAIVTAAVNGSEAESIPQKQKSGLKGNPTSGNYRQMPIERGQVETFCRNASALAIIRFRDLSNEFDPHRFNRDLFQQLLDEQYASNQSSDVASNVDAYETDLYEVGDGLRFTLPWYVALRGCRNAAVILRRFPGARAVGWTRGCEPSSRKGSRRSDRQQVPTNYPERFERNDDAPPALRNHSPEGALLRNATSRCTQDASTGTAVLDETNDMSDHGLYNTDEVEPLQGDLHVVNTEIHKILQSFRPPMDNLRIPPLVAQQLVSYGGSELAPTAAFMGGVCAQEAAKLLCRQFEPINNTFVWNGVERRGAVFEM